MENGINQNIPFERMEEIINWTLPGLTMYYRDSDFSKDVINKYQVGKIFRSQTFVDVSNFAGKPNKNCRFIIASSKAAPLYQINPDTKKWGLHTINCNSFFKVLDIYDYKGITQVFILHIPYKGIELFSKSAIKIGEQNIEEQIINKARESLNIKYMGEIQYTLEEPEWIEKTNFPIGLDVNNHFFSMEPTEPLMPMAQPIFSAIKKMTNDLSDLNEVPIVQNSKNMSDEEIKKDKKSFFSKLFKKK